MLKVKVLKKKKERINKYENNYTFVHISNISF